MISLGVGVVNAASLKAFYQPDELHESHVGHSEITKILELNAAHAFVDFREKNEIVTDSLATILAKAANESHLHNFEETESVPVVPAEIESRPPLSFKSVRKSKPSCKSSHLRCIHVE